MKKRIIVTGVITCLIVIAAVYFSVPAPIADDPDDIRIYLVTVANSECIHEDITGRIDCGQLAQVISRYQRSKLPRSFAPYQIAPGEIEIVGSAGNRTMNLLLGDVNVVYESADRGGYVIRNGEQLASEVRKLIP